MERIATLIWMNGWIRPRLNDCWLVYSVRSVCVHITWQICILLGYSKIMALDVVRGWAIIDIAAVGNWSVQVLYERHSFCLFYSRRSERMLTAASWVTGPRQTDYSHKIKEAQRRSAWLCRIFHAILTPLIAPNELFVCFFFLFCSLFRFFSSFDLSFELNIRLTLCDWATCSVECEECTHSSLGIRHLFLSSYLFLHTLYVII